MNNFFYTITYIAALFVTVLISACSKSKTAPKSTVVNAKPVTFGLYEYGEAGAGRLDIPVTKVGTQTVAYPLVFDTGSTGLTIDATGIVPSSMITSSGITVPGDSVVINGITITNQTTTMSYGDANSPTTEYGNLAYADFTIGDSNGSISIKRVPFFFIL